MGPTKARATTETGAADDQLQSIARALNLLVKLKVRELQGDRKQNEMILFLHSLGCRPMEIAEVLGKSTNDVNPVLSRARNATSGKAGKSPRRKV